MAYENTIDPSTLTSRVDVTREDEVRRAFGRIAVTLDEPINRPYLAPPITGPTNNRVVTLRIADRLGGTAAGLAHVTLLWLSDTNGGAPLAPTGVTFGKGTVLATLITNAMWLIQCDIAGLIEMTISLASGTRYVHGTTIGRATISDAIVFSPP